MPIKDFKALRRFFEASFLSFNVRYIFRITFTSNKDFYLLLAIFLKFIFNQKEKRRFNWPKTFDFLFKKHSIFYSDKTGVP